MAGVWRRFIREIAARLREGWLPPLAILAGVAATTAGTLVLGAPLNTLKVWEVPPSRTHWIVAEELGGLRRPRADEPQRLLKDLPRAPTAPGIQVYHLMEAPRTPMDHPALLLPSVSGGEVQAFVHGVELSEPAAQTVAAAAAPWSRGLMWDVPSRYIRPGVNRVDVLIYGATGRAMGAPIYLGPRAVLRAAVDAQAAWANASRRFLAPAGLAVALAALLGALLDARRRVALLAGAGLATALGARAALSYPDAVAALDPVWGATDRLVLSLALLSIGLTMTRGRLLMRSPPRVVWLVGAGLGLAWAIDFAAPVLVTGLSSPAAWAVILLSLVMMALCVASGGGLRWDGSPVRRTRTAANLTTMLLVLVLTAWTGLARYAGLSGPAMDVAYLIAAALTMTGVLAAAAISAVTGGLHLVRTRLDLSGIVREQKVQIEAAASALEQEMRRAAILEERQRLARDMHDGVGGQLVTLIARVRSRRITIDQVEGELVQGLSELRLVVDSLDAPGQSLADALLTFRLRTQNLVDGAGMALDWSQSHLEDAETGDSRWVLTLYRFMQEAVTNAVRHSGGHRLELRAERAGQNLVVEIADDGRGFDPGKASGGKGLRNLAFRAGQLGGTVDIRSEPGAGTRIHLQAPLPLDD